jgi:hypothetical protein
MQSKVMDELQLENAVRDFLDTSFKEYLRYPEKMQRNRRLRNTKLGGFHFLPLQTRAQFTARHKFI